MNLLLLFLAFLYRGVLAAPLRKTYIALLKGPPSGTFLSSDAAGDLVSIGDSLHFLVTRDPKALAANEFESVEEDSAVWLNQLVVPPIKAELTDSWALDRIDDRKDISNREYRYIENAGQNVTVYVLDTGINIDLEEFQGRAVLGNFTDNDQDDNGHGTFVAGLIGSKTFGVAKKVKMVGVKVLDSEGAGRLSDVLKGVAHTLKLIQTNPGKSIINVSAGARKSQAMNKLIDKIVDLGIPVVVAAGNERASACDFSPSSAKGAITVAATQTSDAVSAFSNTGKCVDLFAPGTNITSLAMNGTSTIKSGTSFSSPLVAGTLAQYWSTQEDASGKQVIRHLIDNATNDTVQGLGWFDFSPNRFVYSLPI